MRIIWKRQNIKAQQNGYSCGIYAIRFLLFLFFGYNPYSIKGLYSSVNISKKNGMSPNDALIFFNDLRYVKPYRGSKHIKSERCPLFNVTFEKNSSLDILKENLPAMVNYQEDGYGHWGVIIANINSRFLIYEPYAGDLKYYEINNFDNLWYSKRYYKKCFISIKNIV